MTVLKTEKTLNFDFQSTTPCTHKVLDAMKPYWQDVWGNPSNRQNRSGLYASAAIENARETLASILHVKPQRLVFTSGATEANNLALLGHARAKALKNGGPGHLVTVATEHIAVLDPIRQLKKEGFQVTELIPDSDGTLPLDRLERSFKDNTFLVSVMFANNEIGVIQPIKQIASICRERNISFHTDAAQGFGYLPIDVNDLGIDFLSLSGHKIYGPKGIGALIINENLPLQPLQWGGGQESGIRSGTLPVPLIIGLVKAAEISNSMLEIESNNLKELRDSLWKQIQLKVSGTKLNGSIKDRLPHNLNFTIEGINGRKLQKLLKPFITCSSASACNNGFTSHVLKAIGRTKEQADASLRLSIGRNTSFDDIEEAANTIAKIVFDLRK